MSGSLEKRFDEHDLKDERRFASVDGKLDLIRSDISAVRKDLTGYKTYWKAIGFAIGGILGGAWAVLSMIYG